MNGLEDSFCQDFEFLVPLCQSIYKYYININTSKPFNPFFIQGLLQVSWSPGSCLLESGTLYSGPIVIQRMNIFLEPRYNDKSSTLKQGLLDQIHYNAFGLYSKQKILTLLLRPIGCSHGLDLSFTIKDKEFLSSSVH